MAKNNPTRGNGLLEDFLSQKRAQKANALIPKSFNKGRILDIGCGSYPNFLINNNFKEKYGVDPSLKSTKFKNLYLQKMDITKSTLPYKDNFFDAVTMLAVFEHIDAKSLNKVLNEIRRVLKVNGVLVITTPAPWSDMLLHNMAKIGLISSEEIHEHKHNHRKASIVQILKKAGFVDIKSGYFELGFNMWFRITK